MKQIQILPGILERNSKEFENKIHKAARFSRKVFVDIIDGRFVSNMTVGMDDLMNVSTNLAIYVQLMTEKPINYLNQCKAAGVEVVVGHVELMESQMAFIDKGIMLGLRVGLALDLETPIDFLDKEVMEKVEVLLLMAVKAGFSEQKFDKKILDKISKLRSSGYERDLFVDGGVNKNTIKACVEAGANALSITSGIWKAEDPSKAYKELIRLARE